jgi:D-alanyl-D-alanine carboxypeptidase/D-alanyl-D-alanine-endopeptidase (penicillin-binding protein 4)
VVPRPLFLCLFGALAAPALGQGVPASKEPLSLQQELDRWFRDAQRRAPGEWGIAIADAQGRVIWAVQPTRPLVPASTVKLLTTGFARSVLGGEARKSTRVVGGGRLDPTTGTWEGTWAVELNGDPSFERVEAAGPSLIDLAQQLADRGIRRLVGPLAVTSAAGEANAAFPANWEKRHRGRVFAPLVGNLTLNGNLISVTVEPAAKVGLKVALLGTWPQGADRLVTVVAKTVAGRRSRLRLEPRGGGRYALAGTLGIRSRPRHLSRASDDPRALLEAAWAAALGRAGVEWLPSPALNAPERRDAVVLADVRSPTLDSLASEINRKSSNVGAELLLRWAALGEGDPAERLTAHVQQITGDYAGVRLVDGSGLSAENRVAPLTFVSYLARFPLAPGGRNFPMLLPPNGAGTLWKLGNGLPQRGVVRAKTGTLGNVASLVGYLGRPEGVLLVSLLYNGKRVYDARQAQWKLFRQLGAEGVVVPSDSVEAEEEVGGLPAPVPPPPALSPR